MKSWSVSRALCLLFLVVILLSGCSSINKARTLYTNGENEDALTMALDYLHSDQEESIRIDAINLVGQIGMENNGQFREKAGMALMPLLDDQASFVRTSVIKNLGILEYLPASQKLIEISLTADEDTLEEIGVTIGGIGPKAIDILIREYLTEKYPPKQAIYKKVILLTGSDAVKKLEEMSE